MGGFEPFQSAAQASSLRLSAQLPVPVAVGTSFNGGVLPKGLGYRDKDSISSALHHRPAFPSVAVTLVTLFVPFLSFYSAAHQDVSSFPLDSSTKARLSQREDKDAQTGVNKPLKEGAKCQRLLAQIFCRLLGALTFSDTFL